jgi:hypothetical protein
VGYRVITGGLRPDHATIARFRALWGSITRSGLVWVGFQAEIIAD